MTALGQDFGFRAGGRDGFHVMPNAPYDGRFTFVRLNYQTAPGGYWYRGWPAWAHGYPLAEQNLLKIMNEISLLGARTQEINTVSLDDPELFRYPVAYIIEVGWWTLTDAEAAGPPRLSPEGRLSHRRRLQGAGLWRRVRQRRRRLAGVRREHETRAARRALLRDERLASDLPLVLRDSARSTSCRRRTTPASRSFAGVYEDNDPTKRLMVIINYNTDVSQFWEWSGTGLRPIDDTNEAYKLGVNYVMYGLTH